jgi:hypothetical protein
VLRPLRLFLSAFAALFATLVCAFSNSAIKDKEYDD